MARPFFLSPDSCHPLLLIYLEHMHALTGQVLDRDGVGKLVMIAAAAGKAANPELKVLTCQFLELFFFMGKFTFYLFVCCESRSVYAVSTVATPLRLSSLPVWCVFPFPQMSQVRVKMKYCW